MTGMGTTGLTKPDAFYESLLKAHEGLSKADSDAFNARLILLMANQIGDEAVLEGLLASAATSGVSAVKD
ncbi:DUF2783 domain-containing protein [Roseibium denhamense]|uniref:DUF2783 domain-containing protein n=1 Tax=Roseibium denhamense TaxID=76305 RepID=A0ABY1P775_9HYPH|nr:DUF2783 domain-containing protein [Roseibium denhamense]MTI07090.1 DUF2783 domain-containing protein [Roseibium denhamense]SMP27267.1 Protein of unknown function [Roseibium denhamense]